MRGVKRAGKAAKFAFVAMPASVLGIRQLQEGWSFMRSSTDRLVNPSCPKCDRGVLLRASDPSEHEHAGAGDALYVWTCSNVASRRAQRSCDFRLLAPPDLATARELAQSLRNERVRALMSTMPASERVDAARGHRNSSRIFYGAAALTFVVGLYLVASNGQFIIAMNWIAFAIACFVFGLKRAFRAWQAITGRVFAEGSFGYWIRNEKWLI